ncbi:VacJ family lipoprotein [Pseudodesulfovibrio cashew]|uniref:VacJ family lipoprotein n=2 Tax=Pseudodesulfovibrio cashew TaxID=2678688 RepID=A0A6I6JLX2_9BACT|nr:VacJ family lipoprotein [Pseudodesulfovibrio cashew]
MPEPVPSLTETGFKAPVKRYGTEGDDSLDFLKVYDPWEPLNRNIYVFNALFDNYLMLPATRTYEFILPQPVRTGVKNVISNANEVPTLINCLLQGKLTKSAITTSRLLINTTFGLLGVFDPASGAENLQRQDEDVGQTLGVWGMGAGPYFVMPFMGPSNVRDTLGFGGDTLLVYLQMMYVYDKLGVSDFRSVAYTELVVRLLNKRSNIKFTYYETGSPFEYELVRFIYTKKRELDIER